MLQQQEMLSGLSSTPCFVPTQQVGRHWYRYLCLAKLRHISQVTCGSYTYPLTMLSWLFDSSVFRCQCCFPYLMSAVPGVDTWSSLITNTF